MLVVRRSLCLVRKFVSTNHGIEDVIRNKGKTDEDLYFVRKDKQILKALMDKLDQAIPDDANNPEKMKKSRDGLVEVIRKHNIKPSEGFIEDLIDWKVGF
ncbi:hypothetical protein SteCoe_11830 [Stentor coeruleus]|uniref:Uncharacterized protein n=1 Tax=Stentor coeruleus TaxID=5963 RepID=A0A1R2CCA4_9CILI|nr:hypothetical protein SteCoe_11830 [Stentor coeruleus]